MIIHTMVDIWLQVLYKVRHGLVPQRKITEGPQCRHWRWIWLPLAPLLEELMVQKVPISLDTAQLTRQCVHDNRLRLAVDNHLELFVFLQVAVVHISELGMHEAKCSLGVFLEHLIQDLPKATGAHFDSAIRDCVLDGRGEDMLCLFSGARPCWTRWLSCFLDDRQVNAAAPIADEHHQHHQQRKAEPSPSENQSSRTCFTYRSHVLQGRERASSVRAHHPEPRLVGNQVAVGCKDRGMGLRHLCWQQQALNIVLGYDHGHPCRVQKIHECLPLVEVQPLRQGVQRRTFVGNRLKLEHDKHRVGSLARHIRLMILPVSNLVTVAGDELCRQFSISAQS
mmetsp:Transcript_99901/g.250462  ORF Transcript_99901/g.250462 Transcript_99901/m.250462 type:complete len:338 (+) Transcript_99901:2065-3078(+)